MFPVYPSYEEAQDVICSIPSDIDFNDFITVVSTCFPHIKLYFSL